MFPRITRSISLSPLYQPLRRGSLLGLTLIALAITLQAQGGKDAFVLEPGKPVERELAGDAAHSYSITLAANQFLHVVVEQKGIDVVVRLFAPDGKQLVEVDSPNGTQGPEPFTWITDAPGIYRLEVRSLEKEAPAARYQVVISELRAERPVDRKQLAAQNLLAEAEQLREQGTVETSRQAIAKYAESLKLWREVGDRAKEAEALNYIGYVQQGLGEMQNALDSFRQALPLFQALHDRQGEGKTLNYIGAIYSYMNRTREALETYEKSLALRRAVGDRKGEGTTLYNIGTIYDTLGERQKALDLYDEALRIRREVGDSAGEGDTLNGIGYIYSSLGEKRKAIEFYQQSLPLSRAAGDRLGEAATLNNIGSAYDSLGDRQQAQDFYQQALTLYHQIGDRYGEAHTLNNLGALSGKQGDQPKALQLLDQSLSLRRAVGDRIGEAHTLGNIGDIYRGLKDSSKALDFYKRALALCREVGYRSGEAESLYQLARLERDLQDLLQARDNIKAAVGIIESLRTKITSRDLRTSYFVTVQDYYELYIDILMGLHKARAGAGYDGEALHVSELARARSLLEMLAEANADIRQGIDPALLERERSLQQRLNAKAQSQMTLLTGTHTEVQAQAITQEIEALTTEYQQVQAEIRRKSPNYAALTQPQPLSLKEIQTQVLDKETLLLEYSLGEEHSYLWAVTPDSIKTYELPGRRVIETSARSVYALLTDSSRWQARGTGGQRVLTQEEEKAAGSRDDLKKLSNMLLSPVAAQLGNKRVVIVADGALQYLPFGALPVPTAGSTRQPSQAYRPLIIEHEFVALPSASTLAVLRGEVKDRTPAAKNIAVLADPVFESDDERVEQSNRASRGTAAADPASAQKRELPLGLERSIAETGQRDARLKIPRLPGTRAEARQILSLAPTAQSKSAFDFAANRETAMSAELSDYRFIHFATHGFLNSTHPELSGLVFSMVDEKGQTQDGFLRAHEIFNLRLPAELVVLSACRTGLGKEIKGEGLVGLTRGFMYAGSPRVVVSLWSVSDRATAELMTRFYRGMLKDGLRPAAALRAAQVSLMKEKRWQSPYYWAAFTLQGEWK